MLKLVSFCAVLCLLATIGMLDYEAEVVQQQEYCDNVAKHVWPDYKNIYNKECK